MTEDQKRKELITLMTFLQNHIKNYGDLSFNDLSFSLENVIKDVLNVFVTDGSQFKNVNQIKHNYPAIDLLNEEQDVAVQVTSNANATKVRKTLRTYAEHKLTHKELVIIGFVSYSKSSIAGAKVVGIEYLNDKIKHGTDNQLEKVNEILTRQIPLNILTPKDDKQCFGVVFDVINRSAVRDPTYREGSYEDMVSGLKEVKEIITTGVIKGKSIRAKALVEYSPEVNYKLSSIEFVISKIIQICNEAKNRNKGFAICLSEKEKNEIDRLKVEAVDETNILAKSFTLGKLIKL